ncbi:N-acetylglucosamine-6-phosphate deacetylase [Arsenicibacter rosenii]|uniref:N-acetylglucosamine-6-phosphate deacetylase n=1 Tax=Arsenicibacter rosenii TaxID=1750698 RepID=A0A1S2VH77_9BACT|nr:N-acetylglucosamine-6-phosphate deacetylase [Arsenicibacter rosenii]OIN58079.1 N-acetylglucosamine-6-phosphate deacetylase [Arsenicibacter rosenii]
MIFTNTTVFTGNDLLSNVFVRVDDGQIVEVAPIPADGLVVGEGEDVVDLQGDYLVPGFVDLQLYGGAETFLNESPTAETVRHILDTHRSAGTTSVVPTLYSTSHDVILQAIEAVREVQAEEPFGVLGLHVEGPYINPVKRGAHSINYVRQPNEDELDELFDKGEGVIKIITIATEVFDEMQLLHIQTYKPEGCLLSLGHSNATYEEATSAFTAGIPLATHLFNAMRGFESREPGVVGAIFDHPTVRASLIADSFHCDPVAIRMAHKQMGDRLFLISDATFASPGNPAGPRASLDFEDFIIRYEQVEPGLGRYTNQEGKLAGSSITLLDAVKVCVEKARLPLMDVLRMASTTPAEIIGMGHQLGKIAPGYMANLVRIDANLGIKGVWAV